MKELDERIVKWMISKGWTSLRPVQQLALSPVLNSENLIISAQTAAGKTEAAFLPALSKTANAHERGVKILYISPLKALINDQYRRLEDLCGRLETPVTKWHGDAPQGPKNRLRKNPAGVVLITPESLEAMLIGHHSWTRRAFEHLQYIIIDELHAFIDNERGMQLQSLLTRLDTLIEKPVARIGLSATLGGSEEDIKRLLAKEGNVSIVTPAKTESQLKLQLRGYELVDEDEEEKLVGDLYRFSRGSTNIIFANSRAQTELYTTKLGELSEKNNVPNEFFAHHGSLAKVVREELEERLQQGKLPTTALATQTLELGIDIGDVDAIAQVSSPYSVASLRQRLGRAGRRDQPPVLRLFVNEKEYNKAENLIDRLRWKSVEMTAMINLLVAGWFEPPRSHNGMRHLSTLVQQTLALIAQYGAIRADQLYQLLVMRGPFEGIEKSDYVLLLRGLAERELITQLQDGQLTLGIAGERLVSHYEFYAAFQTPDEWKLEEANTGNHLGSIPLEMNKLVIGECLVFAGQRWMIETIDNESNTLRLQQSHGGEPPSFDSEPSMLHERIRAEMKCIYQQKIIPAYANKLARKHLEQGVKLFQQLKLDQKQIIFSGVDAYIFSWADDVVSHTLALALKAHGLNSSVENGIVIVAATNRQQLSSALKGVYKQLLDEEQSSILIQAMLARVPSKTAAKHDHLLPSGLQDKAYIERYLDIEGATELLSVLAKN